MFEDIVGTTKDESVLTEPLSSITIMWAYSAIISIGPTDRLQTNTTRIYDNCQRNSTFHGTSG